MVNVNDFNDYNINWRKLCGYEKELVLNYFETQHKYSAKWFFSIWIGMGWFAIIGWIISYISEYFKTGFNSELTLTMPIAMLIVYLFFIKLGHKLRDDWSCRELNALKEDKSYVYDATVLNTERVYAGKDSRHRKYHYYVTVNVDWQGKAQTLRVRASRGQAYNLNIGDPVVVFNPYGEHKYQEYLTVYDRKWLEQKG